MVLDAKNRDKAVWAIRDVAKSMFGDPRRLEYKDLDEIQTILAAQGLQIAPIPKDKPFVAEAPVLPATATGVAPKASQAPAMLGTNDTHWVETVLAMYKQYKSENRKGYVLNMDQLGRVLVMLCRVANIPFKP
jgi:hypothetical protein